MELLNTHKNHSIILPLLVIILSIISILFFFLYLQNGLGLAYNDARSHLDIARRVVEGLKPGLAQIGSVWLPLPHLLMLPTIWNDTLWHSGFSGAVISMVSFVLCGTIIYHYLRELGANILGRISGVFIFATNANILYLQSTAMTELLLMATMTAACYYLLIWQRTQKIGTLILTAFFIMLSTLVRYDGWFLFLFAGFLVAITTWHKKGYKVSEGTTLLYATLSGFGILLWLLWNALIFKDPFYFAFGENSAHAQQQQILASGQLETKGDILLSIGMYLQAFLYNTYTPLVIVALVGFLVFLLDRKSSNAKKIISLAIVTPFIFNCIALYLGHSVIQIPGILGSSWFNIRYGALMMPTVAIFCGYLISKMKFFGPFLAFVLITVNIILFGIQDPVTVVDAKMGASQKDVSDVSSWLATHAGNKEGFILVSAAPHDAVIFSSGLPMKRFIHEGTGSYWEEAITKPEKWARWIVLRTGDMNDLTYRELENRSPNWNNRYVLIDQFPFADVYELREEYTSELITEPILGKQK